MSSNDPGPSSQSEWAGPLAALRVVGALALLGLGLVAVHELYNGMMRAEVESKVLARPSAELAQLRADEEAKLGSYRWVAQKDGVVQIPLAQAMRLTLADYQGHAVTTGTTPPNPVKTP